MRYACGRTVPSLALSTLALCKRTFERELKARPLLACRTNASPERFGAGQWEGTEDEAASFYCASCRGHLFCVREPGARGLESPNADKPSAETAFILRTKLQEQTEL